MNHKTDLRERAKELGPWRYEFEVDGQTFGGTAPRNHWKLKVFEKVINRLHLKIQTILELGSFEGNYTVQLAELPNVTKVIGLESRLVHLARANFVKEAFGASSIEFHQARFDTFHPSRWPQVDAVYCSGLLHQMEHPWDLIKKIAQTAQKCVFLDTHYASTPEVKVEGYSGAWSSNATTAPRPGLPDRGFRLTFKDLIMVMMSHGLLVQNIVDLRQHSEGPRAWLIATRSDLVNAWPSEGWMQRRVSAEQTTGT